MTVGIDYPGVSVIYLCHDGSGKYLLNKRSQACRDEHGRWDCGGGKLEYGELVLDVLRREIQEEYGVDVLSHGFLGYRDVHREFEGVATHWVTLDFLVKVDKAQVRNGEPEKFEEIGWFSLVNFPEPLHSQFTDFLKRYEGRLV